MYRTQTRRPLAVRVPVDLLGLSPDPTLIASDLDEAYEKQGGRAQPAKICEAVSQGAYRKGVEKS